MLYPALQLNPRQWETHLVHTFAALQAATERSWRISCIMPSLQQQPCDTDYYAFL